MGEKIFMRIHEVPTVVSDEFIVACERARISRGRGFGLLCSFADLDTITTGMATCEKIKRKRCREVATIHVSPLTSDEEKFSEVVNELGVLKGPAAAGLLCAFRRKIYQKLTQALLSSEDK